MTLLKEMILQGGILGWGWQFALVPVILIYANGVEWAFHKYVLHGLGRKKGSLWSFHWAEHHRNAWINKMVDPDYKTRLTTWNAQSKEVAAFLVAGVAHFPILVLFPVVYLTLLYSALRYYTLHRKAHLNPDWAKEHLPWHYDHHMSPDPDANWCVTRPWFDWILGTRKRFLNART